MSNSVLIRDRICVIQNDDDIDVSNDKLIVFMWWQGPLKKFAKSLARMQQKFKENKELIGDSPIKIYVVTARSAASSGERAIKVI